MKRRTFIGGVFAGLAATAASAKPPKPKAGDIPRRTFGKTGEQLTVIGQAGGRFPLISFEEAKAITLRAYDLGINYSIIRLITGMAARKRFTEPCCLPFASTFSLRPRRIAAPAPARKQSCIFL